MFGNSSPHQAQSATRRSRVTSSALPISTSLARFVLGGHTPPQPVRFRGRRRATAPTRPVSGDPRSRGNYSASRQKPLFLLGDELHCLGQASARLP